MKLTRRSRWFYTKPGTKELTTNYGFALSRYGGLVDYIKVEHPKGGFVWTMPRMRDDFPPLPGCDISGIVLATISGRKEARVFTQTPVVSLPVCEGEIIGTNKSDRGRSFLDTFVNEIVDSIVFSFKTINNPFIEIRSWLEKFVESAKNDDFITKMVVRAIKYPSLMVLYPAQAVLSVGFCIPITTLSVVGGLASGYFVSRFESYEVKPKLEPIGDTP